MKLPDEPTILASLVDSLDAPLIAVDRSLSIVFVNDAAEQRLGRSRAKLAGRSLDELESIGSSLARVAAEAMSGPATKSANVVDFGIVDASPWWSGGEVVGAVVVAPGARALASSGQPTDLAALAAGLAHEVRNPLAALRGAAELMRADLEHGLAAAPEYVTLILRETARVDALVGRMLELTRPPKLARDQVPPAELVHDLAVQAKALAKARDAKVDFIERFDPAMPPLVADRARLFEALVNLVKNAVEAVDPAGGRIELSAFVEPELRRRDANGRSRPLARLAIRDDGPGLGDHREQLFTPFFTTKPGGTGLGLLLARAAVEAHGGMLSLKDVGGGTEAQLLLPMEGVDE